MKPLQTQKINVVEIAAYAFVLVVIAIGLILSGTEGDSFRTFIEEDGFIEWMTVLGFITGGLVCLWRVVRLWRVRSWGFLALTGLLGLAFIFIAGEEISWGQRLFNVDTPQWMEESNTQREMNLHNLKVGDVKINKLVFSKIAAGVMLVYFAVLMPFYGKPQVARWVDALAIPIPKMHHTLACVIMLVSTQVLITAPRHGELAEFGGAILFTLIVAFPTNFAAFDPKRTARHAALSAGGPTP